jgi:hypothetical protein
MNRDTTESEPRLKTARPLAPEDIRPGQFVALLNVTAEYLPWYYLEEPRFDTPRPMRLTWLPDDVEPMRVSAVCLPYVLVRTVQRKHEVLDLRRHKLARVSSRFARAAFKSMKPRKKKDDDDDDDDDD